MIFVRDKGQMCNNILQYGHVYAWGREHGRATMSMRFAYKYQYFHICNTRYHNFPTYLYAKYGAKMGLFPVVCFDRQIPQLSGCFYHFGQFGSVPYRKSGRVIAPVFQSGQPVQQNRRSLMRSRKPNNSAHSVSLRIKLDEMKQTTYRVCRRFVFKAPMNSEMILTYRIAGE